MVRNWLVWPFLFLAFLVTSCSKDDPEPAPYKRTVLVYIAGDNSLSSFAYKDLAEMKQGMLTADGSALHLLVYMDTGSSPRLVELKRSGDTIAENGSSI